MYLLTRSPSKDSDQAEHSRSLISISTGRILDTQECKVSSCGQWRLTRLCECAGWFEFSWGAHVWRYVFSHYGWNEWKLRSEQNRTEILFRLKLYSFSSFTTYNKHQSNWCNKARSLKVTHRRGVPQVFPKYQWTQNISRNGRLLIRSCSRSVCYIFMILD